MKKRKSKKSFNARLSKLERFFQSIPASLVVVFFSIPLYLAGTLVVGLAPDEDEPICLSGRLHYRCWVPQLVKSAFDNAETIAILSAVILYWKEAPDRKDKKHYEAWQVVEQAEDKETSYSRYKALQDLNKDDVSLEGLDAPQADLCRIILPGAKLKGANLELSDLSLAQLPEANLVGVNLEEANLEAINLQDAQLNRSTLCGAKLQRADLRGANLERANLEGANLEGSNLTDANLEGANLTGANLSGAQLTRAILDGADFSRVLFSETRLENTNLEEVNNLEDADLADVKWSPETTVWPAMSKVKKARNIPDKLQAKLGLIPSPILDEGKNS